VLTYARACDAAGHLSAVAALFAAEIARSSIGTPFARFFAIVPMKPNIARELAALESFENADDATIFRRTASEVMVSFARAMMAEGQLDAERVVKVLKRIAIDFDQPVQVELVFDAIAALDVGLRPVPRDGGE
jgi:hypothetical protein